MQFGASPNYTRPFILHRWGGLGNHRYQAGFSGDVVPSWDSLSFQVYFTLTASNVAFVYWSHDIGGHISPSPPELYTRWIQWGIYSPIFRTHCTKDYNNDRRIWVYPYENYKIMRKAMRHRAAMIPYIYTEARVAYDTGVGLVQPMYYWAPEHPQAYSYKDQYFFGSQLIVSPIVAPMDNATQLSIKSIWLPEGDFISWSTGEWIHGTVEINRSFSLSETPVFVKAGSIIPMKHDFDVLGSAQVIPDVLKLLIFPGNNNSEYTLYEDDGHSTKYQAATPEHATQTYKVNVINRQALQVIVGAYVGQKFDGRPESRGYELHIFGCWPAEHVRVDGSKVIPYVPWVKLNMDSDNRDFWSYDGSTRTLIIGLTRRPTVAKYTIDLQVTGDLSSDLMRSNYVGQLARARIAKQTLDEQWGKKTVYQEDYFDLLNAAEIGMRITYTPQNATELLTSFDSLYNSAVEQVKNIGSLDAGVKSMIEAQLTNV